MLRHVFTLRNDTSRALRILGAEARTPCCSRVLTPQDPVVEAGGEMELTAEFRVMRASGRKKVEFVVSTDDPAMFDTDLTREYAAADSLGVDPRSAYEAGVAGALCDEATRKRLRAVGEAFDWAQVSKAELV